MSDKNEDRHDSGDIITRSLAKLLGSINELQNNTLEASLRILVDLYRESKDAANYLVWGVTVRNKDTGEEEKLEVRVQRVDGKHPAELAAETAEENRRLRDLLSRLRMASSGHAQELDDEVVQALLLPEVIAESEGGC